jgi:hypothetical protein
MAHDTTRVNHLPYSVPTSPRPLSLTREGSIASGVEKIFGHLSAARSELSFAKSPSARQVIDLSALCSHNPGS